MDDSREIFNLSSNYINETISCFSDDNPSNCGDGNFFCSDFKYIPYVYFVLSIISLLCCVIVFFTYFAFPRLSGYSSNIFLIRTSLDSLIAVGHIVSFVFHFFQYEIACQVLGSVFEFLFVAANLWYGVLAYDLIRAIRDPFGTRVNSGVTPHLVVWSMSIVTVVILLATLATGVGPGISMFYFCWISITPVHNVVEKFALISLFLHYLPQFFILVSALVVNSIACFVLLTGFPASSETRQHVLKQNTIYVLVLGAETIILLFLWIAQLGLSKRNEDDEFCFFDKGSFALAVVFAIVHCLRGTVDLFVWWITFSLGFKDFKDLGSRCKAKRRNLFSQDTLCTPLVTPEAKDSVNKNLRRDVMYCINYGILDAVRLNAEEEARRNEIGSVRDPFMAHVMMKFDEEKHQEETEKELFDNPLSQETHVRRIPFQPSNNLRDFAFIDIEPTIFGLIRNSLGISPQEYQPSFEIKDEQDVESSGMLEKFTEGKSGSFFYFTRDFKYIIKTITEEEEAFLRKIAYKYYAHVQKNPDSVIVRLYGLHKVRLARLQRYIAVVVMENLFYNQQSLKMHERYDLKGSTIGRRVIKGGKNPKDKFKKTLKDLDFTSTVSIGPESKQHLMEQLRADVQFMSDLQIMDYSLLLGIHHHSKEGSLHQRSMNIDIDGDEITFVDIGGSMSVKNTPDASPLLTTMDLGVPNDSRNRTHSSVFSEANPISSMSLEDQGLEVTGPYVPWYRRDYGGLRSCSPLHPLNAQRPDSMSFSVTERSSALFPPSDTYYLGVVDILQVYNLTKKLEHFSKTKILRKNKYGISAVDPQTYARRFLEAMDRIIV